MSIEYYSVTVPLGEGVWCLRTIVNIEYYSVIVPLGEGV